MYEILKKKKFVKGIVISNENKTKAISMKTNIANRDFFMCFYNLNKSWGLRGKEKKYP